MNKITIAIIVGILLIGIGAAAFGIYKEDFTEAVDKISAKELCEKAYDKDKDKDKIKFKKCKDKDYEVDVPEDFISQNQQGVFMIE
jgi:hypothetical protein